MGADNRLTVIHVVPEDSNRGAQTYAGRLRDALADDMDQRHLVLSIFAAPRGALRPDLRLGRRSGFLRRLALDPPAVLALRRALHAQRADVVVAHGGEPLKYVVAARTDALIIYYKVGLSTSELERPSRLRLYRMLADRATLSVGVSNTVRDQLHDRLGVPLSRLAVVANGRDPAVYHPAAIAPTGAPLLLFVGQLEPGKRPGLFLDVIEQLRDQCEDFRATIVGDGPLRERIIDRAGELEVDMLGLRQDVPDLLRSAAMLITTSAPDTEGMPGVLVEAGLTGIPALATPAAGVSDVIQDGVTGYVESLPQGLARRVVELLQDAQGRAEMGVAARQWCLDRFTVEASARQWHDILADLACGPAREGKST